VSSQHIAACCSFNAFDISRCPPWETGLKRPTSGLLPPPPAPSKLVKHVSIQEGVALLAHPTPLHGASSGAPNARTFALTLPALSSNNMLLMAVGPVCAALICTLHVLFHNLQPPPATRIFNVQHPNT
jgi:hypothetical protein